MLERSEPASTSSPPSRSRKSWPLTPGAWRALEAEYGRLRADIDRITGAAPESDDEVVVSPFAHAARRLGVLGSVLASAERDEDPTRVAIGRRVRLREEDDEVVEYAIVAPGDGDPHRGWLSADAPLGAAVLGGRAGDAVEVVAPVGRRTVVIVEVREPAVS